MGTYTTILHTTRAPDDVAILLSNGQCPLDHNSDDDIQNTKRANGDDSQHNPCRDWAHVAHRPGNVGGPVVESDDLDDSPHRPESESSIEGSAHGVER